MLSILARTSSRWFTIPNAQFIVVSNRTMIFTCQHGSMLFQERNEEDNFYDRAKFKPGRGIDFKETGMLHSATEICKALL